MILEPIGVWFKASYHWSLSTLLREALFNKKILSCDFIAKDETQFASTGINYIKNVPLKSLNNVCLKY